MVSLETMSSIPIKTAAEIIGKSPQFVRVGLQQKSLPIGSAVKMSNEWTYHVSYELLKKYIGIERILTYEKEKEIKKMG